MQLSRRLQALADMVSKNHILADVGCDHGYIPIFLLQNHRIPKAIAMDIGEGPLKRAQENIIANGLEGYIETRLSDGLERLVPGEAQTILISGMGGPLMEGILSRGQHVLEEGTELILQPQSDIPHFRMFLNEMEYKIIQEDLIFEDGKFYPMMKAVRGKEHYTPLEYRYGPRLLESKSLTLEKYLKREQRTLEEICDNLQNQPGTKAKERCKELERELEFPREALRLYEL